MNVNSDTNYEELARCTDGFNGAQLKAVCVEAGMIALRRGGTELAHEDYMEGTDDNLTELVLYWFLVVMLVLSQVTKCMAHQILTSSV